MTPIRPFGVVDFVLFLYVVLLAGGVRAGYLMLSADNARNAGPFLVQDPAGEADLRSLASNIKDKNTFSGVAPLAPLAEPEEQTAHASPGYPWLLGLVGRAVAADHFDAAVRWGQCAIGALTAGLYFLFARRAFRSLGVATLAGMLCALHPFWVVDAAAINDGVVVSFLVALSLFVGARANETGGPFASLLYGLGLAASALVRAALLPFAFVGLAWFLWRSRKLLSGWLGALLAFLGFVIGVAPWTIRNWQAFGEPTPIVDSTYLHVWMGNNPRADGGPVAPEEGLTPDQVKELKDDKKQPERYARLGPVVWEEMRRDPAAVAQHRFEAGRAFFFGAPARPPVETEAATSEDGRKALAKVESETAGMHVAAAGATPGAANAFSSFEAVFLWVVIGMTALGLLGWRWSYGWRAESMPAVLAMIWIPLPYLLSHAEVLSGPRLPLDGVLLCYSAFAFLCFVPGVRHHLRDGARVEERLAAR